MKCGICDAIGDALAPAFRADPLPHVCPTRPVSDATVRMPDEPIVRTADAPDTTMLRLGRDQVRIEVARKTAGIAARVVGPTRTIPIAFVPFPDAAGAPEMVEAFKAGMFSTVSLSMQAVFTEAAPYVYRLGIEDAGGDSGAETVCMTAVPPAAVDAATHASATALGLAALLHFLDEDTHQPVCGIKMPRVRGWSGAASILAAIMQGAGPCPLCDELQRAVVGDANG